MMSCTVIQQHQTSDDPCRRERSAMPAVGDGQDLAIVMVVAAVDVLVFDPEIGEVHMPIEVGQVVIESPLLNLVLGAIRATISVGATTVALVQPLLVLALELVLAVAIV